jgi:hypothetical protein
MDIDRLMMAPGPDVFYSADFMATMESHIEYFKNHPDTVLMEVDASRSKVYAGDLYGYLNEIRIEPQYHWFIARLNGMFASTDFNPNIVNFFVPSRDAIDNIRIAYKATGIMDV